MWQKRCFLILALFLSWGCGPSVLWRVQTLDQKNLISKEKPRYQNGRYKIVDQNGNVKWIDENQINLIDKQVKEK